MRNNKIRYTLSKYKSRHTALYNRLERARKKAALAAAEFQRILDRDKWSYERKMIARINGIRLRLFPELHNRVGYYFHVQPAILSDAAGFNRYIRDRETDIEYDNSWAVGDLLDLLHYRAKTEPKVAKYLSLLRDLENAVRCRQLPYAIYKIR